MSLLEHLDTRILDPLAPDLWMHVGVALFCGAVVGLERQIRGTPVGVRTSMLVCLSTSIFVRLGASFQESGGDPTRTLGQVVTGVGFLGAGVILARGDRVVGVTTAAVIWGLAAIGAAVGFCQYAAAAVLAVVLVGALTGVELLDADLRLLTRRRPPEAETGH